MKRKALVDDLLQVALSSMFITNIGLRAFYWFQLLWECAPIRGPDHLGVGGGCGGLARPVSNTGVSRQMQATTYLGLPVQCGKARLWGFPDLTADRLREIRIGPPFLRFLKTSSSLSFPVHIVLFKSQIQHK